MILNNSSYKESSMPSIFHRDVFVPSGNEHAVSRVWNGVLKDYPTAELKNVETLADHEDEKLNDPPRKVRLWFYVPS